MYMPPRMQYGASGDQMQTHVPYAPPYYNTALPPYPGAVPMYGMAYRAPFNTIPTAQPFVPAHVPPPPSMIYASHPAPSHDADEPRLPSDNMWYGSPSPAPRAASYTAIAAKEMMVYLDQAAAAQGADHASRLPHLGPTPVARTYTHHIIDALGAPNEARLKDHARNVSTLRPWTPQRLRDLAFCIVWEVVTAPPHVHSSKLASLTCLVGDAFSTAADPESYAEHVRRYALATFRGWWKRDLATSVFRVDPTARRAQTERALNLAIYMGYLYVAGYLSSADLVDAARTLVAGGITHSEQLVALRDLLAQSTAGLSSAPAHEQSTMSAVMRDVAAKGAGLREEQSLRGAPVESAELRTLVDDILSLGRAGLGASFKGF
ncbi:hypothetical protein HETIRDRAFT_318781 [Heterobasidion irregulare TC 32-1]|uniref:Uncharacterized protein n=1 Tax=Heterobasidion irregulare (strain TC 32-1) TaxID=747525 RepID=W4K8L3_HETIT|nr:uncharacterized protein HETIRDRAFT_318781 [Heterobasidion irregulare TC 32-1]ETW82128.1 hypothetical protein HETIRDRAFT_318781 [Heterobasidion irregulare TC 32-1]